MIRPADYFLLLPVCLAALFPPRFSLNGQIARSFCFFLMRTFSTADRTKSCDLFSQTKRLTTALTLFVGKRGVCDETGSLTAAPHSPFLTTSSSGAFSAGLNRQPVDKFEHCCHLLFGGSITQGVEGAVALPFSWSSIYI